MDIPLLGVAGIEAKIDTGAYTSAIHCYNLTLSYEQMKPVLYFSLEPGIDKTHRFENFAQKTIKNSFGEMEERFVITVVVHIGSKRIKTIVSLSNRDNMKYPFLIGRRMLKGKFLIDVKRTHTRGISLSHYSESLLPEDTDENRNIIQE